MKKSVCMKGNDPLIHTDYRIGIFPHSFRRKMKSNSFDRNHKVIFDYLFKSSYMPV